MGVIAGSSENLLKIVNDILDLSKIRADKIDLEMISFSVLQQMENTIEPLAARAIEKGIEYSAFIDPVLPKVIGDPTKLSQIMTNLIGNAVKFTGEGGSVDVDVRKIAENDNNVIIRFHVKDSGIGISKEQIENIFEPFSQADSSTTREFGGTGLGLTISRDIITHMGGVLDIISEEGKGSEFFFELGFEHAGADDDISNKLEGSQFVFYHSGESNLRQMERNLALYIRSSGGRYKVVGDSELGALDDDDILVLDYSNKDIRNKIDEMLDLNKKTILISTPSLKDQTDKLTSRIERIVYRPLTASKIIRAYESIFGSSIDNIPNEGANKNAQIRGLKVLVAEDNPINQKLILRVLEDLGTVPTLASNGKEAFDLRSANNYDIILMDVQMPVMGGLEAAQKIKKMEKYEGLPHAPIIALTANALQGDREKYLREGMDDYIPKPIRIEQVGMILRKYCEVNNSDSALKKLDRKEKPEKENIGEKSILLYCNDKLIQSIHSHVVDEAGFKMVSAENESEFLELFDSGVYEYVLIDAKILPENGDTLIKIIKGSGSIPMVYTTASSELTNITAESYSAIGMIRQILAR
jgi:CheY-like chemotaxis protein